MSTYPQMLAEFVPEDGLWQILYLLIAILCGAFGFFRGRAYERKNELRAAQREFVPAIQKIVLASNHQSAAILHSETSDAIEDAVLKFRMHISGRSRERFDRAYKSYREISHGMLFPNNQKGWVSKGREQDFREAQAIFTKPLIELIDEAEKA